VYPRQLLAGRAYFRSVGGGFRNHALDPELFLIVEQQVRHA